MVGEIPKCAICGRIPDHANFKLHKILVAVDDYNRVTKDLCSDCARRELHLSEHAPESEIEAQGFGYTTWYGGIDMGIRCGSWSSSRKIPI